MSLYIKKGSDNIYFSDLIILIDKNGAPYCIFTTLDSFEVGDVLILYINDTEYVRFKVYRIKEFKDMGEPIYYQIIALHLSDWEWKSTFNSDGFELGVQKDWSDGARTIKLYVTSLDAMNLSLIKEISETPTTIPSNAPVLDTNIKCDGNIDALTTKMGTTEPYTILIKNDNNIQIIYDSQITNEIDVSDWIPFESYEKWTDPSGTSYQSQIKYYIKEGHFATFYYAGEKYDDGTNTGTINTMILYPNKTEIYDTFNPSISRVQITGTSATREGRQFGSGTYTTLDFIDDISCVTFKKTLSSWDSGESNKKTINFLVPKYLAKDEDDNKIKSTKLLFRFRNSSGGFPGDNISSNDITFYIKVYKNGTYIETLNITKNYQNQLIIRPNGDAEIGSSTYIKKYPDTGYYYEKIDEESQNGDTDYIYEDVFPPSKYRILFSLPDASRSWNINNVRFVMYGKQLGSGSVNQQFCYKLSGTYYYKGNFYFTNNYAQYYYDDDGSSISGWTWSKISDLIAGIYMDANDNNEQRITQFFIIIQSGNYYAKEYTITNDDLYTFEFYHNEESTLENINIIGSLIDFEEI